MKLWSRSTIRARLTVLYASAFFIAGAMLVAVMLFYLKQSLDNSPIDNALNGLRGFLGADGLKAHPFLSTAVANLSEQIQQQRRDTVRSMVIASAVALVGIGLVAGLSGWLLAGRVLRPLHEVTATARRIADRNLHERISLSGPTDEIKELADTFDAMLDRLSRAFDVHQRFVADASHELRTPLAINRTLIEVALDDPEVPDSTRQLGETLLAVNQRHERLIEGLLVLAGIEQARERSTRVDLGEIAGRVLIGAQAEARRSGVTLTSDVVHTHVIGDPALLERLIGNLVDNAIRYNAITDPRVHIDVSSTGHRARLLVANTGPVVDPGDVARIFERFQRLDNGHGGAGLGLSIVRSIATAHHGQVHATTNPQGGLTVEVLLPLA